MILLNKLLTRKSIYSGLITLANRKRNNLIDSANRKRKNYIFQFDNAC